jgi:hypothetical protein
MVGERHSLVGQGGQEISVSSPTRARMNRSSVSIIKSATNIGEKKGLAMEDVAKAVHLGVQKSNDVSGLARNHRELLRARLGKVRGQIETRALFWEM